MSRKVYIIFFGVMIFVMQLLYGQSSFIPKNLGTNVNTSYDEINPVLSPDGKTLYFVRVNHPENTFGAEDSEDIWFCTMQRDGTWSTAQRDMSLNVGRYNAILSLSADGNSAMINGIYNTRGSFWRKRGLSIATRGQSGWGVPVKLKVSRLSKRNRGLKSSGMMSSDGNFIVLSFSRVYNNRKSNVFYCLRKENGKYTRPRALKALKSMGSSEDAPFLQADNKTLYFSSDRLQKGAYDIFKIIRTSDGWKEWSNPVKLSDTINTNGWDSYFRTNTKGGWGYFCSTEESIGGADIFKVKLFEENPFVIVSGKIFNAKNNKPLIGKSIKMSIAGIPNDSVRVSADSATYRVRLPLGKLYSLSAKVKNFNPASTQLDLSAIKEFTRMRRDVFVQPLPYVLVKGRILDRSTNQPIPSIEKPTINLLDETPDSLSIDPLTSTYTLKIKYGKTYQVDVTANNYASSRATLDLTNVEEYGEVPFDLFLDEEKSAVIKGTIIDKKTGKPISQSIPVAIHVEGMTTVRATIDPIAGTYELKLPLGSNYTISASAPNYYPLYEMLSIGNERSSIKIFKDLVIIPIEVGQSIRLNNIFFETGKSKLKPESFSELDRVADFLKNNPDIKIEIGGHTDNVGKAASNMKLSQARATAVANYIIAKGLKKENIVSKGYGMTKPVATNKTKEGKAQNRRVEFTILDK
jgi:outer membrane protein OmpA-like peptidoglycan-associated protein